MEKNLKLEVSVVMENPINKKLIDIYLTNIRLRACKQKGPLVLHRLVVFEVVTANLEDSLVRLKEISKQDDNLVIIISALSDKDFERNNGYHSLFKKSNVTLLSKPVFEKDLEETIYKLVG
ncbi:MAG: hypothetical protein NTY12_02670 [Candidatus Falkowbacteria bacterium]|nr:hypothetical protein [Candidatus Falkowbacteria bacterium]